jgi:hypothetical protein
MGRARSLASAGAVAIAATILSITAAWACVSGPAINLSTIEAKAGQEVGIKGASFRLTDDVLVRFNALDGPLLTTIKPVGGNIEGTFTVPAGTKAGTYVIMAMQNDANGKLSLAPIRTTLNVIGDGGTPPVLGATAAVEERTPGLVLDNDSISGGTLALIALGVGGIGMFLAGMAALFAGRKGAAPSTATVGR